ncbi:hypothetical protein MTR67_018959 [Solanum verrucosum]|uniref:Transmembrane protein n=1 Tax=Solanum verrucosum TaxID=315347 RepID=A0AAF0QKL9_SOLVR|nr:hypothetical protein MTR67_018959 [Solanum verrucosum]
MMKRQGSQVPLVPTPKLKSQALVLAPKSNKKVEKKKSEVKTKKAASVSFLGVLFFMLIFGGLVPLLKVRYGGMREPFVSGESFVSGFYEKHHGRVLTIDGHVNGTGYFGKYDRKDHSLHCGHGGQGESNQQNSNKVVDEFVHVGNGSDPLAASLYVPRDDKLVEIDKKLIIQSVLASEKAMVSHGSADKKNREPSLVVPGDLSPSILGIHPRLYRSPAVGERVHGSEEKENVKETMQQWHLESVAVFVLVDGDGDGIMGPDSVSRIFIVLLIDSVKYVTYSCMLPFIGSVHVTEASSKNNVVDTIRSTNCPH